VARATRDTLSSPWLRLITQALHLAAAGVIVGSAIFMRAIMIPRLEAAGAAGSIPEIVDRFYSIFPWIALVGFSTTGLLNCLFWLADTGLNPKESLETTYVRALLVKVLLANALLLVSILFGFLGSMQEDAKTWLWVPIALGVLIVLISAGLRRSPSRWRQARRGVRTEGRTDATRA
jgi:uncharacterized membrane protein